MSVTKNRNLTSIVQTNSVDPNARRNMIDRINRLAWDEQYREDARVKSLFAQARRRAKEKPVSLPKLTWLEKNA